MILAGDIGGTSTRLAYYELQDGRLTATLVEKYPSRAYTSLNDIVRAFVGKHRRVVKYAAFGIAGPVREGRVATTNLPWVVTAATLARDLELNEVALLNDLEANTFGVLGLESHDLATLNAGAPNAVGNIAVIAAGTGLGEAGAVWDGQRYHVFATEGGHTDFAPRDELEAELLLYLKRQFGEHVSCERVLSGPGLYNIYRFLRDSGRGVEEDAVRMQMQTRDPAAVISERGLEGTSSLCVQALELFMSLYGAEAGNLALKLLAQGGVFVGGGIAPKILPKLQSGLFMEAFVAKGRFRGLMEAIPVRVVLNDQAALYGAARYAAIRAGLIKAA